MKEEAWEALFDFNRLLFAIILTGALAKAAFLMAEHMNLLICLSQ